MAWRFAARVARRVARAIDVHPSAALQARVTAQVAAAASLTQPAFPRRLELPVKYAQGLPERAVEILLARTVYRSRLRILDVGHANAQACHLDMLRTLDKPARFTGLDIADPMYDTTPYYEISMKGDITAIQEADSVFDQVWCISTIEHIGLDNSAYTADFIRDDDADMRAIAELGRVLRPGGTLLVTAPYGRSENLGWARTYDGRRWQALLDRVRPIARDVSELYFRHTYGSGWHPAEPEELRYIGYYDQANSGAGAMAAMIVQKQ